ncbi:MAG: APC family permease [Actinomycetota bacterium]|nr:APC family permease [Actinomycetota bacterium]
MSEHTVEERPEPKLLRANSLGLFQLVVIGIAYMGLALTVYFNVGLMEGITGSIVPLAFAAVTIAMLPTAASFAVMNARRPSAGSVFTWLWEATVPSVGVWLGWVLFIGYTVGTILMPVMFGLFFNSLLNVLGIGASKWTAIGAGLVSVAFVGFMTKNDIRVSARLTAIFIMIEAGFVALFAVYIAIKQAVNGNFTLAPFNPGNATAGWTGFQNALLFAILAIAAFDIVAPVAEETKAPRRLVPRATIYVTIGAGLYWVLTSFAFVISEPAGTMAKFVNSGEFTPIYLVAKDYLGALKVLVPLTGITAVFAAFTAISIAASRILYAIAREGLAPAALAKVEDRRRIPWNAHLVVLWATAIIPVLIVLWQHGSPLLAFAWIGQAYVFFVLIPYTLTCVANIIYHLKEGRANFHIIWTGLLPVAAIVINCYIFYKNFIKTLLIDATDFTTQSSIPTICFAAAVAAVFLAAAGLKRTGKLTRPQGFTETDEIPAEPFQHATPGTAQASLP